VPAYLDAICTVVDILSSREYVELQARLRRHVERLTSGLNRLDLVVMGECSPIVSVLVGDEAETLRAGRFLFDHGFYVQSVLFPAVPYHSGVIRIQCNSNHTEEQVDGLVGAFRLLWDAVKLPSASRSSVIKAAATRMVQKGYTYIAEKLTV
jgi:7-keto-8-aminopelargonate synthetase-like enzyme